MCPRQDCLTVLLVQNSKHFHMQAIKKKCSYQNSTINVTSSPRHIFLMPFPIRLKNMGTNQKPPSLHLGTNCSGISVGLYFPCLSGSSPTTFSFFFLNFYFHPCFLLNIALIKQQRSAFTISKYQVLPLLELPKDNTACLQCHK